MSFRHAASVLALLACTKQPPISWQIPATSGLPEAQCSAAPPELSQAFAGGVRLDGGDTATILPDLELQAGCVAQVEITAERVERCGDLVVLTDPLLRFWSRRGEALDVAIVTDALVHPRLIMSLHRDPTNAAPPVGAWLAPDRTSLRHVGPLVVGTPREE